tara:strand:+ start:192 stop:434 length:243 start_codon:yes stop_codon:yes gene_type:complete
MNKIVIGLACLIPLFGTYLIYTDFLKVLENARVAAFQQGVSQTTNKYEAILKIERSPEWIDTQCMMLNFDWIEETNNQGK